MNMMAWNGLPKCTELGINMKQTHKIAYDYAMAMKTQRTYERGVEVALNQLCRDNQIFSLAEPLESAYTNLVQELLSPDLFDWLLWWMYDTDYGQEPMFFTVVAAEGQQITYDPTELTLYRFLEIVDV